MTRYWKDRSKYLEHNPERSSARALQLWTPKYSIDETAKVLSDFWLRSVDLNFEYLCVLLLRYLLLGWELFEIVQIVGEILHSVLCSTVRFSLPAQRIFCAPHCSSYSSLCHFNVRICFSTGCRVHCKWRILSRKKYARKNFFETFTFLLDEINTVTIFSTLWKKQGYILPSPQ